MVTFPFSSAFYLNLQAVIEKKLRWQITLGWFNFSITWARSFSITIHVDCCKGDNLQLCMGPHTRPRNTFSPQNKTATPRLVSIWLFQQQVLHQQLFYVSSKNMKCGMGSGWTQPTEQNRLELKIKTVRAVCTWKKLWVIAVYDLIQLKHHLEAGLPLCAPGSYCPVPSLMLQWLWWALHHKYEAGNREEQKSGRERVCQGLSQTFYWTPYGKLSLLIEENASAEPHVWSRLSLMNESAWIQVCRQAASRSLAMNNTDGQSLTCWIASNYWGSLESDWLLEICSADNSKDKLA